VTSSLRRILRIAQRDYIAAVFTKGFLIGLILAPLLMGAGLIAIPVMNRVDSPDRRLVILDHTGSIQSVLESAARKRNEGTNSTARRVPVFHLEFALPSTNNPEAQRLELADRIRAGTLHAFAEIDTDVLRPYDEAPDARIRYYARSSVLDDMRGWFDRTVNQELRRRRLADAGLDPARVAALTGSIPIEGLTLPSRDRETGTVQAARKENPLASLAIPFVSVMILMMLVMMGSMPLLQSVVEEKAQRIAEVLLGCASPWEIMTGKLLGGVGVTLTAMTFYLGTGIVTLGSLANAVPFPFRLIPWFLAFGITAVLMYGSLAIALGSACSDTKDAQHLQLPVMLPVMLPVILMMPVLKEPGSLFATVFSFIPPFTPLVMMLRLGSPAGVPAWQPWVALAGVLVWTALTLWLAGRIFRVGILLQGRMPKLGEIVRWGLRG
jgi:ABC-type Na+ efflux pump permease subunit